MARMDLAGMPVAAMTPISIELGATVGGGNGATSQQVARLGSRWSFEVTTAEMDARAAMYWIGMLTQAREEDGAIMPVIQAGFDPGEPGSPTVAANTPAGRVVPLTGLTPGYHLRRGQFVSYETGAGNFLHMNLNDVIASAGGTATQLIGFLLRDALSAGDAVHIAEPLVAGIVTEPIRWPNDRDETVVLTFRIEEEA